MHVARLCVIGTANARREWSRALATVYLVHDFGGLIMVTASLAITLFHRSRVKW